MAFNYLPLHNFHTVRPSIWWILLLIVVVEIYFYLYHILPITPRESGVKEEVVEKTNECLCNGENFCFPGLDENEQLKWGRPFSCRLYKRLEENGLLDKDIKTAKNHFETLNASTWVPVFMTVVSENHYKESQPMVGTVMNEYPGSKVIYYDAGLTEKQANEIRQWPNVDYRRFNFSAYPAHIPNLRTYAFKLAQLEVFKEHKTFYYFDASVRIRGKMEHLIGVQKKDIPPLVLFTQAVHSVFAAVHPGTIEYFPLPKSILQTPELEANTIFISDSPYTRYTFKWFFLCAMTADCIAPMGAEVHCAIGKYRDTYRTYINCHRFDQAVFNILHLSLMLGDTKAALEYKYLEEKWTKVDTHLIDKFHRKRMEPFSYYAGPLFIDRWS